MAPILCISRIIAFGQLMLLISVIMITASPSNDEVKASARTTGKSVADYWVNKSGKSATSTYYADACSFYGACLYGAATGDSTYRKTIYSNYKKSMPTSIPTGSVDANSAGLLPLYLFQLTKDSSMLKLGKTAADVSVKNNGYKRYAIDDTYMTGSLMIQAYRATGDASYLDFFADYSIEYTAKLLQSNGLYWHRDGSHIFWGRGNGWGAASETELLLSLPGNHPKRAAVLDGYKKHMAGLLAAQKANGMWMQVLTSTDPKNWEETSGTGMFLFAMFTGLKNGWLDSATFLEPAKKGWKALAGYVGSDGKLKNICVGFWGDGTENSYLTAATEAGNAHGTCAILWAAAAAINLFSPSTGVNRGELTVPARTVETRPTMNGSGILFDLLGRSVVAPENIDHDAIAKSGLFILRSKEGTGKCPLLP
jgi:unsaturated rhamnogalacturonyl hydrolase